jgi:CRP-like cAMP-binding protein
MEQDHAHYAVRYRLTDLKHDDGTDSEVKKRIWYALRRTGIEIPYPSRNLFVTELSEEREAAKWHKEHERRLVALKKVAIFAPLDDDARDHLAERCRVEVFGGGETILRQGAPGDSLYLLRKGAVGVRVAVAEIEREVATLSAGELFGEMSLMTGESRRATVVAKGDVECYVIDRALFQEVVGRRTTLVHEISHILAARQAELDGEVKELGAEVRSRGTHSDDLLGRIRAFFGLAGGATGSSNASGGQ